MLHNTSDLRFYCFLRFSVPKCSVGVITQIRWRVAAAMGHLSAGVRQLPLSSCSGSTHHLCRDGACMTETILPHSRPASRPKLSPFDIPATPRDVEGSPILAMLSKARRAQAKRTTSDPRTGTSWHGLLRGCGTPSAASRRLTYHPPHAASCPQTSTPEIALAPLPRPRREEPILAQARKEQTTSQTATSWVNPHPI